jgi:RNA polymerase sigma-70 factor (ECF subfamily)
MPVEQPLKAAGLGCLPEPDVTYLVLRMAGGDEAALAELYDATSPTVYGLALRILADPPAAEEVTLEVYSQAFRQAQSYDPGRGTPWAWLTMLARSRALDRLRADEPRRRRERPLDEMVDAPAPDPDPDEGILRAERADLVRGALARLTPEQRRVIEIAYFSGLSHTEIAARLEEPLGTVKTRIRTAMLRLREALAPARAEGPA